MIKKTKDLSLFLYQHSLIRYGFVGATTFIIDFCLLVALRQDAKLALWLATFLANFLAIIYNFVLNRFWAFGAAERSSLQKHLPPYIFIVGLNLIFSVVFVSAASSIMSYKLAKVIAVAMQTAWTYPLYKKKVFVSYKNGPKTEVNS